MNRIAAFALGIAIGFLAFGPALLAQDSTVLGGYARKDGISQKLRLVELPGTVYAGNNVTLGTTSSYTGTATASGNVACVVDCSMTATATGTGTETASNTGTLTFTGTYSTTETGTNAGFGWTGTAMVTGTASVTSTGTHTQSTTGAGTVTASNDGTRTATGTVTGSVVNVKNGTGSGSGASTRTAYLALAKSWTGSGTWTVSTTYTLTGTTTATITGTGTTTDTVYPLMTGTGSNSWTGTLLQTNTTTGSVALSSANGRLIIGAVLTGTTTVTGAPTQTLVSPNGTKTWQGTLTVTQTDIAQTAAATSAIPMAGTNSKIDVGWLPATATPTASKIPIADGSGLLNAWITGQVVAMYNGTNASDVTSTGGWTDVATVSYTGAGTIMVWATARAYGNSGGGTCGAKITVDGSDVGAQNGGTVPDNNTYAALSVIAYASGLSSGAHTVKLQVGTIGTNCTVGAGYSFLMVQRINPP